jgi:hypothetical protein
MVMVTKEQIIDFWYDFDNQTLFRRTKEVDEAISIAYQPYFSNGTVLDGLAADFDLSFKRNDHPKFLEEKLNKFKKGYIQLADIQEKIFKAHFSKIEEIQQAFELFAQGVLFDSRAPRPKSRLVHMMDGTPEDWVGYHRWNAFIRTAIIFGANTGFWDNVNKFVALAWAIQFETNPTMDDPNNQLLDVNRLSILKNTWLNLGINEISAAFVNFKKKAPLPETFQSVGKTRFQKVQDIFNNAAVNANPIHGGLGKFWERPLDEFLELEVYGFKIIELQGENKGKNSNIIKVLKGELRDMPRMPLNRLPLSDKDINFIEKWINDGCPAG